MELRPYQRAAVDATLNYLRSHNDNPCIVAATGAGKSIIIAELARFCVEHHGRCLILAHVKELLEQNADKIRKLCPQMSVGVYSAGLNSRDTSNDCLVGGIQSIYTHASEIGQIDLVIIDEVHMVPSSGEGRYLTFLNALKQANPHLCVIGLTATPYRTSSGLICKPGNILNTVSYEIGVRDLIKDGYLSTLISKNSEKRANTSKLKMVRGEFDEKATEKLMNDSDVVNRACKEIVELTQDRKSVIIFCCSIDHAEHVMDALEALGQTARAIYGHSDKKDRADLIQDFRDGKLKYLVNVAVLTTGFDAPNIDTVVLLRPTASPGLYSQMVGRGLRLSPNTGKKNCLILDYGGNIMRHGPVDDIYVEEKQDKPKPTLTYKTCPKCASVIPIRHSLCPECGYEYPKRVVEPSENPHGSHSSSANILSTGEKCASVRPIISTHKVQAVHYYLHIKRDSPPSTPRTIRVAYQLDTFTTICEYLCPEHSGYAHKRFVKWWSERTHNGPTVRNCEEFLAVADLGLIDTPLEITVKEIPGDPFPRITKVVLPDPPQIEAPAPEDFDDPF